MNNPTSRNRWPLITAAIGLIVARTPLRLLRRTRIWRMVAVNPTRRTQAALAVLAVAIIGCSQASEAGTSGAGPTTTAASATSATTSVEPLVTTTTQVEVAVPQPPVEFTGRILCGPPVSPDRGGDTETLDVGDEAMVLNRYRGGAWRQTVTMTDPRLEGTAYETWESDEYRLAGAEEGPGVWAGTRRIENEAGAWEGRDYGGNFSDGTAIGDEAGRETDDTFAAIQDSVWIGEGAYAGLIAIIESTALEGTCGIDVRGIIFDGAPVVQPYISR